MTVTVSHAAHSMAAWGSKFPGNKIARSAVHLGIMRMQFHYPLSPTADFKAYSRGARRVAPRRPRDVAAPHNPSRGGVEDTTLLLPGSSHRRRRCCRRLGRVCGRLTAVVLRASLGAVAAVLSSGARAVRAFAVSAIGSLPAPVKVSLSCLLLRGEHRCSLWPSRLHLVPVKGGTQAYRMPLIPLHTCTPRTQGDWALLASLLAPSPVRSWEMWPPSHDPGAPPALAHSQATWPNFIFSIPPSLPSLSHQNLGAPLALGVAAALAIGVKVRRPMS